MLMNVSRSKITLKLILSLSFLFYIADIKEFKSDTFDITDHEIIYEMVALCSTGTVSNYFRHYAKSYCN